MKILRNLPIIALPLVGASSVLFTSCGAIDGALNKLNQPISDTGFNPLDKPGKKSSRSAVSGASPSRSLVDSNDHGFKNGDIVEVVIPNTALFAKVPKAGDRFKKILNVGDSLRVIGGEKDFIKVVTEGGVTGFVSSVMVVSQGFLTNTGPIEPTVTEVKANETPIVPDVAPDPVVKGIGSADPAPVVAPAPVPSISAPVPVPVDPDPGLIIPDVPAPEPVPVPVVPSLPDVPSIPDPEPLVPGLPGLIDLPTPGVLDIPAPEPSNPGLPE